MKILKLYGDKSNTGGIVNFQNSFSQFKEGSVHEYFHFRTGKVQKSRLLSNPLIRFFDQVISYIWFPFYLIFIKPDVVEINSSLVSFAFERDSKYAALTKLFLPKARLVLFNHGWDYEFKDNLISRIDKKLISYFNLFDHLIVLTGAVKQEINQLGVKRPISIITTGVNISEYLPYQLKAADKNSLTVLFLSRLEKSKGIVELLDVIPSVIEKYPNTQFIIAGSGSYEKDINAHPTIKQFQDNIQVVGYLRGEDKLNVFSRSDIYVFPSYGEGCPVSVLEALAVGLPLVYTPVGALADILTDHENGLEIPVRSKEALHVALLKLIEAPDLRRAMVEKNKALSKDFDLATIHQQLEEIYTKHG